MYRDIAMHLKMPIEQVESLPLDEFWIARKEVEIIKEEKFQRISDGVFVGIARVINEMNKNKKGGDK